MKLLRNFDGMVIQYSMMDGWIDKWITNGQRQTDIYNLPLSAKYSSETVSKAFIVIWVSLPSLDLKPEKWKMKWCQLVTRLDSTKYEFTKLDSEILN